MYLKTVLVILGAGHPKKGHKNHKADVGSVHPGLLRGETKGCALGSALVWRWILQ